MRRKSWIIVFIVLLFLNHAVVVSATVPDSTNTEPSQIASDTHPTTSETIVDNNSGNNTQHFMPQLSFQTDIILPLCVEFFGAFLGVLTALALESYSEKKQWDDVNASLLTELQKIGIELEDRKEDDYSYYQYVTPIWDINMAAGNLSLLTHSKSGKNYVKKDYIDIYAKIHYAQSLERDYIQGRLLIHNAYATDSFGDDVADGYINQIDLARKQEALLILEMIQKLPKEAK